MIVTVDQLRYYYCSIILNSSTVVRNSRFFITIRFLFNLFYVFIVHLRLDDILYYNASCITELHRSPTVVFDVCAHGVLNQSFSGNNFEIRADLN